MKSHLQFDSTGLTIKQALFVRYYIEQRNATLAAKTAGYKGNDKTLAVIGCELLKKPQISTIVHDLIAKGALPTTFARKTKKLKGGCVYFIQEPFGRVKIGKAKSVECRMTALQNGSAYPLTLLFTIEHENPLQLEKWIHSMFSDKRVFNEWFELTQSDLSYIKQTYGKT